jgi:cytochrome b6-f complex iron-sulfur subunit
METGRREFIKKALFGVLALFGLGFLVPAITLVAPVASRDKELAYFPLLAEEEIPRVGVKKAELAFAVLGKERKARVFIVSSSEGPVVFSAICSHLGCLVSYHKEKQEFVCPCHGGKYDLTGRNIFGPPPAPLTRFPLKIQDGKLLVGVKV